MVSAAGPFMTLVCAAAIAAVFAFAPDGWFPIVSEPFWAALAWLGSLSIFLVFFLLWQGPVANVFWGSVFALTVLGQIPTQLAEFGRSQMLLGRPF